MEIKKEWKHRENYLEIVRRQIVRKRRIKQEKEERGRVQLEKKHRKYYRENEKDIER